MNIQRIVEELEQERERVDLAIELLNELGSSAIALLSGRRSPRRDRATQSTRTKKPRRLKAKRHG